MKLHRSPLKLFKLPDAGAGLEDVEVLEDVGDSHQPQGAEEPQPDPGPG